MINAARIRATIRTIIAISTISANSYAAGVWVVNAASCTADAGSIQNDLYIGTGGTIKFASGKVGDIVLYCPVANLGFTPNRVMLTHYDDTTASGNHVTVQFIKMAKSTGLITSIATADSDRARLSKDGNAEIAGALFNITYDPIRFAYYLRIDIVRSSPTANEIVYCVTLFE